MVVSRGTGRLRGGAYAFSPERPSAVSMLGWVGHRNGDRDCEPAELTEHQARDGGKLGGLPPRTERQNSPRSPHGGVLLYPKGARCGKAWNICILRRGAET